MRGLDTGWRAAVPASAWLAGVALQLQQAALAPAAFYLAAVAVGLAAGVAAVRWRQGLLTGVGALAIGFGLTGGQASLRLTEQLASALEQQDLQVIGVVASLPQQGPTGLRFRLAVESARLNGAPVAVPPLLALGWYRGAHEDASATDPRSELRAGQRWRFTVRLRQPHGHLNPHGFDYELMLFEQGVRATGYVRDAPAERLDEAAGYPLERWRQRVRDAIEARVPDRRTAGVLAALAVGDQGAIEREDWELFRATGIAHLVSISGLHVTMFAWLAGLATGALWRRSPRAMLAWPAPRAALWGGVLAAIAYALSSGWGVPAQRTVWMLATVALLQTLGRHWPWPLVLLSAAVVVTALDPWALLQPGFWLSFAAVGLLMASHHPERASAPDAARGWRRAARTLARVLAGGLRTQVVATLGLAPLTLVFFQQLSLVGFVANLVAIPVVTLLITPLALLGAFVAPLWTLGAAVVQGLCSFLGLLAAWPDAVWWVPVAPRWAQGAALLAALLLVLPLPWRLRLLALPLALPLLMPAVPRPPDGQFEVLVADIGQGTAVLVRTRAHLLLYDAGPQYSRESDAGQRVLLPLLRALGERRVDTLLLSHRDNDHVGGAPALLAALPVQSLLSSLEADHPLRAAGARPTRCEAGQRWVWDGVQFELLQPSPARYVQPAKPNALSCVLRVSAGGRSLLLTGDIEREQEAALVAADALVLRSDVLVLPHHGSKTSSSPGFLDAVQPRLAIIQAGYRNRFGHPAAEVAARYRERGITLRESPGCGAWRWSSGEEPAGGICHRDAARRYWHHRPFGAHADGAPGP